MAERPQYTAEEVDAAVQALGADPDRFAHAQEVVQHATPGLRHVLERALDEGGWFGQAHEEALERVAREGELGDRVAAIRTLVGEETRLGMLVGVTVGFELARELEVAREAGEAGTGESQREGS